MSDDDTQTMTIDGRVHTYMTNAFVDEAERLIAALVEKGCLASLGRRIPDFPENTREARRKQREAISLGIRDIWLVGEIKEADRTYRPGPPPI